MVAHVSSTRLGIAVGVALSAACHGIPTPLPAPGNFAAVFDAAGVDLSWDPIASAEGYEIRGLQEGVDQRLAVVPIKTFQRVFFLPGASSRLSLSVRAMAAGRDGVFSAEIVRPPSFPRADVHFDGNTATLKWDASFGPATISQGASADRLAPIGRYRDGLLTIPGLTPSSTYVWQYLIGAPPVSYLTQASGVVPANAPSAFAVSYVRSGFQVTWPPVPGHWFYQVRLTTSKGSKIFKVQEPLFGPSDCAGDLACQIEVATASAGDDVGFYSSPFPVTMPPAALIQPALAVAGVDKVVLTFPPLPPGADHLVVLRAGRLFPAYERIGTTTSSTYVATAVPWEGWNYAGLPESSRGVPAPTPGPWTPSVWATSAPGPMNLGGTARDDDVSEGQTVTVAGGARLMAVEVAVASADPRSLWLSIGAGGRELARVGPTSTAPALLPSLGADLVTGAFFDFSALPVSAGETLTFALTSVQGALSASTSAATAGGHLKHGSVDQAHDLVYKLYLVPDSTLAPAGSVIATAGAESNRLDWDASSGAARYEVYRQQQPGVTPALIGSTQQPWFLDAPLPPSTFFIYSIRAVDAKGNSIAWTDQPFVKTRPERLDAENLGDGPAAGVLVCPAGAARDGAAALLGQSFIVRTKGTLAVLELAPESGNALVHVDVLDASRKLLGSGSANLASSPPAPLRRGAPGTATIDLLAAGIAVVPGDALNLQISASACIVLRDTDDQYPAGNESRDGIANPQRDLAFRTLVR